MATNFPRQDCAKKDKTPAWMSLHLDYAESILRRYNETRLRMTRLYESYNGVRSDNITAVFNRTYGKQNRSKFIAYRLGRTKVSLLHGEWLKRPLSAAVETINSEAKSAKMEQIELMLGAMFVKPELEVLKQKAGVDVMNGAQVPDSEEDPMWEKMSFKDKQEDIMQIILDNQTIELDLKRKIGDCFLDLLITSMCYCKVELDEQGETRFHRIDPRDAIYEEISGDDYLQKSPVKGCRQVLSVHDILMRYTLTQEQRNKLDAARVNPDYYTGANGIGRGYMRMSQGQLMCDVIHIEWLSVEPEYYKISPKTKTQMMVDGTTDSVTIELDTKSYEQNKELHDKNVASGKYKIETKYKQVVYEATRIGGCIDVNMRLKPFQKRHVDNPAYILDTSYHGCIQGKVDGVSISMQQMIENFDNLYDIVMYQINKDIARAKGRVLFMDRAGLPAGKKQAQVLYEMVNDGLVMGDSSASGNAAQKNLSDMIFKEVDFGLSQSFEYLVNMKNNIVNDLNQITGINENREGQVQASATVTNTNSAISASRTITEPLFFVMNGFVKVVMQSIVDSSAISWAFYKTEKGEQILGSGKFNFLKVTKDLGYKSYGVHMEDGGKYADIKQKLNSLMEFSLNAKEIRPIDVMKVQLAETTAQMKNVLQESWVTMEKARQASNESQNQFQQQMQQMQLQQQLQISNDDREDRQQSDEKLVQLEGQVQMLVDDNKAKNKIVENQHSDENQMIMNTDV
jgi:hypothetical protein